MTKEELAKKLDGMDHNEHFPAEVWDSTDLVVIMGDHDDTMDFYGAIVDEFDCYGGGKAYLDGDSLLESRCEDPDCPYFDKLIEKAASIEAVWNDKGNPYWTYETDIPHATFRVMEDGDIYCLGIVFNLSDVR